MNDEDLLHISYSTLLDLSTDEGIYASGREEHYGCLFGRDSAITLLKILRVAKRGKTRANIDTDKLLAITKQTLQTLIYLQGKEFNIESGEAPGKFIHEYRKNKYERLTTMNPPWYVYPDGILRNYDSIDATPLALIALHRYFEVTHDYNFIAYILSNIKNGLNWLMSHADRNTDHLLEYELPKERVHGGLRVQSWTDSYESLLSPTGVFPAYPISPVEVQGYSWLALRLWGDFFKSQKELDASNEGLAAALYAYADIMKIQFNKTFIFSDSGYFFAAQALDGKGRQIQTVTGNPLLLLWASHVKDGKVESILKEKYVDDVVRRSFMPDMFDESAGIRTMSSKSGTFNPTQNSYHNGSFWPKLNGMAQEGLEKWGYTEEATKLRKATLKPLSHFGTPIELYIKDEKGEYKEYENSAGQKSCLRQAWTAAAMLDLLTA